jgi:hypothetical protein
MVAQRLELLLVHLLQFYKPRIQLDPMVMNNLLQSNETVTTDITPVTYVNSRFFKPTC